MANAVWANTTTSPITVCDDGRLQDAPEIEYPQGTKNGQAGWDVGLTYQNSDDLRRKLSSVKQSKGALTRLALNSHGAPGLFDLEGVLPKEMPYAESAEEKALLAKCLTSETIDKFKSTLEHINTVLNDGASLILMGCVSGAGPGGSELLKKLSVLLRGHPVVGFITIGVSLQQVRSGKGCVDPGMRVTDHAGHNPDSATTEKRYGSGALMSMPWASESSPQAKIAKDGNIVKQPLEAGLPKGMSYLEGKWNVELPSQGPPSGVMTFSFEGGSTVWWADKEGRVHETQFTEFGGAISWSFPTDALKRRFTFKLPLQAVITGEATKGPTPVTLLKRD